jgi:hypothetical protein
MVERSIAAACMRVLPKREAIDLRVCGDLLSVWDGMRGSRAERPGEPGGMKVARWVGGDGGSGDLTSIFHGAGCGT